MVTTTQENFSRLPIQRFYPLYVAFMIWPPTFLEDYLNQYKVPRDVRIFDATWTEFLRGISERYGMGAAIYTSMSYVRLLVVFGVLLLLGVPMGA